MLFPDPIDPQQLEDAGGAEPPPVDAPGALDVAMRYLAPAARSCAEVRRHLLKKGFDESVAGAAAARLVELSILDDGELARTWVEHSVLRHHDSPAKARQALAARGVPLQVIAEALGEASTEGGDLEVALAAGADRLRVLHGPAPAVRRRLGGFLARRGYDADVIDDVCSRLLGDGRGD